MPLVLICENCKKEFITRKRGSRIIRFCSKKCSHDLLDPQKKDYWKNIHQEWEKTPLDSYKKDMMKSFESFFDKTDGCWIWNGSKKSKLPYGNFTFRKFKNAIAHRISWMIYKSEIPNGMLVLHKCDNPSCVNPDHLFLGTHLDNERDKLSKGRHKGEKLNPEKIREIKSLFAINYGDIKIAKKFNISYQTVWSIKSGKTWKDII